MAERSKLSALLAGVMEAVQKASTTAGQQNLHILKHYFKQQENGSYVPLTTRVEITPGRVIDMPLICLLEPSGYLLDELSMRLSVKMKLDEVREEVIRQQQYDTVKAAQYLVEMCPRTSGTRPSDVVDIEVRFKACDRAEGLSRLIEDLNNTLSVKQSTSAVNGHPEMLVEVEKEICDADSES